MHRLLIVGVGSIGERHLRCFGSTGRAECSICEVNESLRNQVADRYNVSRRYDDLNAALADSFDAAVIAAPAPFHIPMANQLAEADIHLLIEKPLSTSLDGIDALQARIESRNLKVAVAYQSRTNPALAAMKEQIDSGRFGKPIQLLAISGQNFPHYRPAYRDIYYNDRATGGGAIQDALTHMTNAGEWLVGPIDRLVADADHKVLEGVDVEDVVHLLARHGDVMASYCLNQFQAPNESSITVNCERGSARFVMADNCWRWVDEIGGDWQEKSFGTVERDDHYIRQANAFLDLIEGRRDPHCSLQDGLQTLRVNLAALQSADNSSESVIV